MPSPETLERFITRVEENAHVEAIQEFYGETASMRENHGAVRIGRDTLVANERAALARAQLVDSRCVRPVLVNGNIVVIRWVFRFAWKDGKSTRIEELAYQCWDGERIVEEQFFYDPAQLTPR